MKKLDKIFIFIFAGCISLAVFSPLIVALTKTSASKIVYSSGSSGVDIKGETKQYGKEGHYSSEVTAVPSDGFIFLKWSDGVITPNRSDVFIKKDQSFAAYARYSMYDAPLLQVGLKRDNLSFAQDLNTTVDYFSTDGVDCLGSEMTITKIANYENLKSQYKFDLFVTFPDSFPFISNSYLLLSMFNDRSFLHNFFAYSLLREQFADANYRDLHFLNLTLDSDYVGFYMAFESMSDFSKRTSDTKIDWEITISKSIQGNYVDYFSNSMGFCVLTNNTKYNNKQICESACKDLVNLDQGIIDGFDLESITSYLAINEFMKNNACLENDIRIYKKDGIIYFDPFISYSLSSPMFRWFDYGPTGRVDNPTLLKTLLNKDEIKRSKKEKLDAIIKIAEECFINTYEELSHYKESINADFDLWISKPPFGSPNEYMNMSSWNEYCQMYKEWVHARIAWLTNNN